MYDAIHFVNFFYCHRFDVRHKFMECIRGKPKSVYAVMNQNQHIHRVIALILCTIICHTINMVIQWAKKIHS